MHKNDEWNNPNHDDDIRELERRAEMLMSMQPYEAKEHIKELKKEQDEEFAELAYLPRKDSYTEEESLEILLEIMPHANKHGRNPDDYWFLLLLRKDKLYRAVSWYTPEQLREYFKENGMEMLLDNI